MNEPDIIMYSPEQLRYARETLAYRAPEVMTDDERLLLRAATRAPGAPALINPPEVCRAAVDALAASRAPLVGSLLAAEISRATPRTTDPAEWARHNQQVGPGCVVPVEPERPLELAPHEVDSPVRELLTAVERAASELHGQGAKSDRIALQLLTAIARFEGEVSP